MERTASNSLDRILRLYLGVLLACAFCCNILFTLRRSVWAPRNELAHYDYIDRITDGRVPGPGDGISDYSFRITLAHFTWRKPDGFDGTQAGMGVEAMSYEAQQPPVYYALLAVPNRLLKHSGVSPPAQIATLRVVQLVFVHLGFLLLIPIFRELQRSAGVRPLYGYLAAALMMLTNVRHYSSLGNDSFSPLVCNLAVYFYLLFWRTHRRWAAVSGAAAVGVAFLTKYTNGLLLPVHIGVWLFFLRREARPRRLRFGLAGLTPFFILGLYLALNGLVYGDILKTSATATYFAALIRPLPNAARVLRNCVLSSFSLSHLSLALSSATAWAALGMMALNATATVLRPARNQTAYRWLVRLSCALSLAALAAAVLLNRFRPGGYWAAFRHYSGMQLFWYVAIFNIPVRMNERVAAVLQTGAALLLGGLAVRYALLL